MLKLNTTQKSTSIYSVTKHTSLKCAGISLHVEFYILHTSFKFSLRNAVQPFGGFLGDTITSFFFLWLLFCDLLPCSWTGPLSTSLIVLFRAAKPDISLLKNIVQSNVSILTLLISLFFLWYYEKWYFDHLLNSHNLHTCLYIDIVTRNWI